MKKSIINLGLAAVVILLCMMLFFVGNYVMFLIFYVFNFVILLCYILSLNVEPGKKAFQILLCAAVLAAQIVFSVLVIRPLETEGELGMFRQFVSTAFLFVPYLVRKVLFDGKG